MSTLRTKIYYGFLVVTIFLASCSAQNTNPINQSNSYSPVSKDLYETIIQLDSALFDAFNTRNPDKLMSFFSEDLEFYHDLGGVTDFQQNINAFRNSFASGRIVRREVVMGSLEVYPIKDYGAVEIGIHRFYVTEKSQKEKLGSEARFVHIWCKTDSAWKITRVISYGHKEY